MKITQTKKKLISHFYPLREIFVAGQKSEIQRHQWPLRSLREGLADVWREKSREEEDPDL